MCCGINFHEWFEWNTTTGLGFCKEHLKERPGARELKAVKGAQRLGFQR